MAYHKTGAGAHHLRPIINLDFVNNPSIDTRFNFERNSPGYYYDHSGRLTMATNNEPRFDHDPITGEQLGLLSENSIDQLYQDERRHLGYALSFATYDADMAPDGTMTACRVHKLAPTGGQSHVVLESAGGLSTSYFTYSVYIKPGTHNRVFLQMVSNGAANNIYVYFTLDGENTSTGVTDFGSNTSGTSVSPRYEILPNGWYRISASVTGFKATSFNGNVVNIGFHTTSNNQSYTNTEHDFYWWGPNIENNIRATSYIPNTVEYEGRSSRATYTNSEGWLRIARKDEARYDYKYDGSTWIPNGLLVEPSSENKMPDSQSLLSKTGSTTVEADTSLFDPMGSINAQKITWNNGYAYRYFPNVYGNNNVWTTSFYVKPNTGSIKVSTGGTHGSASYAFYLSDPDNVSHEVLATNNATVHELRIENVGRGWYRCSFTDEHSGSAGYAELQFSGATATTIYHIWGIQVETGYHPTSYIPTYNVATTRSADIYQIIRGKRDADICVCYDVEGAIPGINKNPFEMTTFIDQQAFGHNGGFIQTGYLEDTTNVNGDYIVTLSYYDPNNTLSSAYSFDGDSENFGTYTATESDASLRWKAAVALKSGDSRSAGNGVLGTARSSAFNDPSFDVIYVSNGYSRGRNLLGHVKRFAIYNKRVSDAQLVEMTEE